MATRLELEQEAGRRAAAKRKVAAMGAAPDPAVIVSDEPLPAAVVEELAKQDAPKKRTRTRAKPQAAAEDAVGEAAATEPEAPIVDLDEIDALLDL